MENNPNLNQPLSYYKDLLNKIDHGYLLAEVLFDAENKPVDILYIEANAAANRMTGVELAGKRTTELDPDYEQHWFDIFGRVAKTGIAEKHELSANPLGVYYKFHAFKVGAPEDCLIAVIYEDVTERHRADAALKESEARLLAVFEALPAGVGFTDTSGKLLLYNSVMHRYMPNGLMPSFDAERQARWRAWDAEGKPVTPSDFPGARALRGERVLPGMELLYSDDGGRERWTSVTAIPVYGTGANVVGLVSVVDDIEETKQAGEALKRSEEQFRLLTTASSSMVYKMSADWKEMFTLNGKNILADTDDPTGDWTEKYIPQDDRPLVWQTIHQAIASKGIFELEHRVEQADGSTGWVYSKAVPVVGPQGEITGWLGAGSDITKRKQVEERQAFLLKLNDALRPLADPYVIQLTAMKALGKQLGTLRAQYYEVGPDDEYLMPGGGYATDVPLVNQRILMDNFGAFVNQAFQAGQTVVVNDAATDRRISVNELRSYDQLGFRALIGVPLVKGGRFTANIVLHRAVAHEWTAEEITLTQETAERTWAAVERAKVENALLQREQELARAHQIGNIGGVDIDIVNNLTGARSPEYLQLHGLPPDTIFETHQSWLNRLHPDDCKRAEKTLFDALESTQLNYESEYRIIRPDNKQVRWIYAKLDIERDAEGKPVRLMGVHIDITPRRQAEEALRESEDQYRRQLKQEVADRTRELNENYTLLQTIFDTTLVGMSVFAPVRDKQGTITDFKIVIVNKKIARSSGRDDLAGQLYAELFPGIKKIGLFDLMIKTIETGGPGKMEYHYTYDGVDSWYSTMFVKGEDILVSTNVDITERKLLEEIRIRDLTLLQQSEELAASGSWDYDLLIGSFTWSDGMYRLFNLEKGKEIRPEIYLQYITDDCRETAARIVGHIKDGDEAFNETITIQLNGRVKVVRMKATVLQNAEGYPVRVLGVDMDVTAAREAEEKLRQMEAVQQTEIFRVILRTQEEERRRISESLHNGLGQMLYGIKISLSQLSVKRAVENPREYETSKIYTNDLISEAIRDSRRISHELMPAVLEEFGLRAAIIDVCRQMEDGVKFHCLVELGEAKIDKYMQLAVFRTLQELMVNVVKHAQATLSRAEVSVTDKHIVVQVSDNGRGMDTENQGRDGIGLASIKSKIDLLKGTLDIETLPCIGTTVKVALPYIHEKSN